MPTESEKMDIERQEYINVPDKSAVNILDNEREKYMDELKRAREKREKRIVQKELKAKKKAIDENVDVEEGEEAEEETEAEKEEREKKENEEREKRKRKMDGKCGINFFFLRFLRFYEKRLLMKEWKKNHKS